MVKLNVEKLLGFRIAGASNPGAKAGIKIARTGVKLGAKPGAKIVLT